MGETARRFIERAHALLGNVIGQAWTWNFSSLHGFADIMEQ